MKKNWQIKLLSFFLLIFITSNLNSVLLKIVEMFIRFPLDVNSSMSNLLGVGVWSRIIVTSSNPLFLIIIGCLLCSISIIIIRSLKFKIKR